MCVQKKNHNKMLGIWRRRLYFSYTPTTKGLKLNFIRRDPEVHNHGFNQIVDLNRDTLAGLAIFKLIFQASAIPGYAIAAYFFKTF